MPHLRHGRCENGGIVVNATSSREEAAADLDCVQVGTDRVDCFLPYVDETSQDSRDASQGLDQGKSLGRSDSAALQPLRV